MTSKGDYPSTAELVPFVIQSLEANGGTAHFKVIEDFVSKKINLSEELRIKIRSGNRTEFAYRLSWARTKAKSDGLIVSSGKGNWTLKKV